MGTFAGGPKGTRLISDPALDMTQKDLDKNTKNIRDIKRAEEMRAEGTPGEPYSQKEINERYAELSAARKFVMDSNRNDKIFTNRQTESQAIIPVPGDDKITYKTGSNLKEHRAAATAYEKALEKRDRATAKGDKRGENRWAKTARNIMEQHVAKNKMAGPGMAVAAAFSSVDRLQNDFKTYQKHLSNINKYSSKKGALTNPNSRYNKAVKALVSKNAFQSDNKNIPKFIKDGIKVARSYQQARKTGNARKNKAGQLNKLLAAARGKQGHISAANTQLESSRRAIQLRANRKGIAYEGVSPARINQYIKTYASRANNSINAKKGESDFVRRGKINQGFHVWTRANKAEALKAFRNGKVRLKQS